MKSELVISDVNAARALSQQHRFLSNFVEPRSPSEVARQLGMTANLAHHHARKLKQLGLLYEQRREAGRVYYQLSARQFRVGVALQPPGDPDENAVRTLTELSAEFLKANARSWSYATGEHEGTLYGFEAKPTQVGQPTRSSGSEEAQPAHLDALTLRLTPHRYRALALALSRLLTEAAREGASASGEVCTLAVLGFRDSRNALRGNIGRATSTFLPFPDLAAPSDQ